ncbi:MAG: hypothetical protein HY301_07455 [Verrucomicrobia bacterium]|nr:hypothetical protein [Verrucomicrobiota bacterium]
MTANPTSLDRDRSATDAGRTCKLVLIGVAVAALGIFCGGILVAESSIWFGLLIAAHSVAVLLFLTASARQEFAAAADAGSV